MLNHYFPNRCLLCKVQFVDALLEQLLIDVVKGDNDQSADGFKSWLVFRLIHIHRLSDVLQALHVKFWLIAEHDRELLEQHAEDVVVAREDLSLLRLVFEGILGGHAGWRGTRCIPGIPSCSWDCDSNSFAVGFWISPRM